MPDRVQDAPVQEVRAQEVFIGPRPFERSERGLFFGRDREISELLSLVISSRVVLCYAPSGAGKTSLINAGLQPRLEEEGFEVLPSTRVRGLIPGGIDHGEVPNLYIFNALLSLAGEGAAPGELAGRTLAQFLSARAHEIDEEGFSAPRVLVFDQFEELLTSYPERWQERDDFFHQVRDALQEDPLLRVLFVMREDFLARIEPYVRILKPIQQARFRLALLGPAGAAAAVNGPLRGTGRHFKEGVADTLIEELLKVRVETVQGEAVEVVGEYVEPVQLQVVCRNLWTSLPPDVQEISSEHVETYGDVDHALQEFYESSLAEAKARLGANESALRQWFEEQLITPAGTRGIVFRGTETTADLPNHIVSFLEDRHLIRGEWRAGSRWYELTHDRFIEPIKTANERWRGERQSRRNSLVVAIAVPILLGLVLLAGLLGAQRSASQTQSVDATSIVAAQSTASVAEAQATQANENAALTNSLQLAALSIREENRDRALLLAIEAAGQRDTPEARLSLHRILSNQPGIDEEFLQEYNPHLLSPKLVTRLDDHENWVASVAFSPDGRKFVSGSSDTTLILWDLSSGEPVGTPLRGHTSNVQSVAFSPDGVLIASCGLDAQILIWNASTGERIGDPLLGHVGLVTHVAFSPDGKRLASAGDDGTIRIWDLATIWSLATGESPVALSSPPVVISQPASIWSVAWAPDGIRLASASADSTVRLFETEGFSQIDRLTGHDGIVRSLAFSSDGRWLASGSVVEEVRQPWGQVFLWDVGSGELVARPLRESTQPVRAVAFDPNGQFLAAGRDDGTIAFWDLEKRESTGNPLDAHDHRVMSIAFSPDGGYLLSGSIDETIVLWDLFAPTSSIAFSPSGDRLATSQGAFISLWDPANRTSPLVVLSGHAEEVLALKFSPDGSKLASAGRDDAIRLWDGSTGMQLRPPLTGHEGDVLTLDFSPDGRFLISAGEDRFVLLWDLEARLQQSVPLITLPDAILNAIFRPNGEAISAGGRDGSLATLDLTIGERQDAALPGLDAGQQIASLALSADGQKAAYYQEAESLFAVDEGRAHGIEISGFNQAFDPAVNPEDIDFIVVRATDGIQIDNRFEAFLKPIQAVPIRGATHLFRPDLPWQKQADTFLSAVKDKGFHFYTLDLEITPEDGSTAFGLDAERWLMYVDEQVDQKILLQTGAYFGLWSDPAGGWMREWPLLVMAYPFEPDREGSPTLPPGITDWKIWQYAENTQNRADYGVGNGGIYLDVYNGTAREMWEWLEISTFSIYNRPSGEFFHPARAVQVTGLNGIVFSPDGSTLAAGGGRMVTLLDAGFGEVITALISGGRQITSLGFQPDGRKLAVGTEDGHVFLWDLSLLDSGTAIEPYLEFACKRARRNFTASEWGQYFDDASYRQTCPNLPLPP